MNYWLPLFCNGVLNEKEITDDYDDFYKNRPTRIFWANQNNRKLYDSEYSRFKNALKYNYYKERDLINVLNKNGDDELIDCLPNLKKAPKGIVFPIIDNENMQSNDWPKVVASFSSYRSNYKSEDIWTKESKYVCSIINRHFNRNEDYNYIPEITPYLTKKDNKYFYGKSYQLALVLTIFFKIHEKEFKTVPKICCTGLVDSNGKIKKIDKAQIKYEAAVFKNFDFILFPEENRDEINRISNNHPNERVKFFEDIESLHTWVLEQTESSKKNRIINSWAQSTSEKIEEKDAFYNFFNVPTNCSLNIWKALISCSKINIKVNKLNSIYNSFIDYLTTKINEDCKSAKYIYQTISSFLPDDKLFYTIPYLFSQTNSNGKDLDDLYILCKSKLESSSLDKAIAARKLIEDGAHSIIGSSNLRSRYPKLIFAFYNTPSELLFLFSTFAELSNKERQVLNEIDININENDEVIMKAVLSVYDSNIHVANQDTTTTNNELIYVLEAKYNYKNKNNQKAEEICSKYLKNKILNLQELNKEEKDTIIGFLNSPNKCLSQNKELQNIAYEHKLNKFYEKLIKFINNRTFFTIENNHSYSLNCDKIIRYTHNLFIKKEVLNKKTIMLGLDENNNLRNKISIKNDIFPIINLYLSKNQNSYKSKTNLFSKDEKGNLKTESILFWIGKFIWKDTISTSEFPINFRTSLLSGILCNKNINQDYKNKVKDSLLQYLNKENFDMKSLLWLYFIKNKDNEITNAILKYINLKCKKLRESINNTKRDYLELGFIASLFNLKIEDNEITKEFKDNTMFWFENYINTRKTGEILYPLYLLLKQNKNTVELAENIFDSNNAQFITEFIRVFCLKEFTIDSLFRQVNWKQNQDKINFISLSILTLKSNPTMLKHYMVNNIDDFANFTLALRVLNDS